MKRISITLLFCSTLYTACLGMNSPHYNPFQEDPIESIYLLYGDPDAGQIIEVTAQEGLEITEEELTEVAQNFRRAIQVMLAVHKHQEYNLELPKPGNE